MQPMAMQSRRFLAAAAVIGLVVSAVPPGPPAEAAGLAKAVFYVL